MFSVPCVLIFPIPHISWWISIDNTVFSTGRNIRLLQTKINVEYIKILQLINDLLVHHILSNFPAYHHNVINGKYHAVLNDRFNKHPPSHWFYIIEYLEQLRYVFSNRWSLFKKHCCVSVCVHTVCGVKDKSQQNFYFGPE